MHASRNMACEASSGLTAGPSTTAPTDSFFTATKTSGVSLIITP